MARKNKPGAGRKIFDGKNKDAVLLKLMQAWSVGASDHEAAAHAEISPPALCQYLKTHPEISEQKEQLKEKPVLNARVTLAKAIQQGDGSLAIKYLERVRKREFSTLQELSGPNGAPLNPATTHIYIPHNGRNPLPAEPKPNPKKPKAK